MVTPPLWYKWETPRVAKRTRRPERQVWKGTPRGRMSRRLFFRQQRGEGSATPFLSIKILWRRPNRAGKWKESESDRSRRAYILSKLWTIHPNPGPGKRNKTEEGKKARRERRYDKRRRKREQRAGIDGNGQKKSYTIVTWNVQRMTLRNRQKRKARRVAEYATRQRWDAVLLSEITADRPGVAWLGEGEDLVAIIHSERAGILLRGDLLKGWHREGQKSKVSERTVSVKTRGLALTATYLPVWKGNNEEEIENVKDKITEHLGWAKREEIVILGGDFNAHIGGNNEIPGICGKYGLRTSNEKGSQLAQWCEENNLAYLNSFYNHKKRGTWFNRMNGQWYELDGFMMQREQRHRHARKLNTVGEMTISDHKPKKLVIEVKKWHWDTEQKKRTPKIKWEKLRDPETAQQFKRKVEELLEENEDRERNENETGWTEIVNTSIAAAKEVCGEDEKRVENPWMVGKEERLQELNSRVSGAVSRRNQIRERMNEGAELDIAREDLKTARKVMKRELKLWEKQWWEAIISKCKEAGEKGEFGTVYKTLRELGKRDWKGPEQTTKITTAEFKTHFEKVSKDRFENTPEEIDKVVDEVIDISRTEKAGEWREILDAVPDREEIVTQMKKMRESAPGGDGVRLIYLMKGGERMIDRIVETVQYMFMNGQENWEIDLKTGLVIPLHKKGDRDDPNKYRGVVLLAMASRIVARIMADRIRIWSEKMELLDDDQCGFRKGRSTCDVTQMMVRMREETVDLKRRMEQNNTPMDREDEPVAKLLDLRKAYPRVNRPALWGILQKCGIGPRALRILKDLHEATMYRIKGREGESEAWVPERGLREGCPSSPGLFNIYHQAVMRSAGKARKRKAAEMDLEPGLAFKWVPGSSFPGTSTWEKQNSEAKKIRIDQGLFADDTTVIGKRKELTVGLAEVKKEMDRFEERNNEDKEEELVFGTEDGDKIRVLGSYLGPAEDIRQRIKRAGAAWSKVKARLKGSRLSKRTQARVVEACAESTMLFDCQARTWQIREIKKLQSSMDRMYRHVWSRKHKQPLRQMQEEGKNMQDVRNELGVKSVRYKIEKRCLERIGHVMRMDDERKVKGVVLGWLEDLEEAPKMKGKKRKTVLFWKKLLKEGGIDYTTIGKETSNRKEWKRRVMTRMKHLEKWERRGGKRNTEERGERNQLPEVPETYICTVEECRKVCKSKAGLVNHTKRMHEISSQKVTFKCNICNQIFKYETNLVNHTKTCNGIREENSDFRTCSNCNKRITYNNFARHRRTCGGGQEEREVRAPRVYRAERGRCSYCNGEFAKTNMARHQNTCQTRRGANL